MDEPAQARRVLDELRAWMGTVLLHEPHIVELLRPCWYRHPAVVQILLDVQAAWTLAHRSDLAQAVAVDRALEVTERHLPHLETRLSRLLAQCTSVRHDPPETRLPRPAADMAAAYVHWWAGERTPRTEPGGAT